MCRWFITGCFCFVLILSQQQCLSAALRPAELDSEAEGGDVTLDSEAEGGDVTLDGVAVEEDLQRVRGRDSNITRLRHPGSRRERKLQRRLESLEEDIQWMKEQLLELKRYVSKHQTKEKCANAMCPVGSMKYGCDCLLYVHHDLEWRQAAAYCARMNGKLVNVRSKGMQKHIKTFLKAQLGRRGVAKAEVYTGLIYTTHNSLLPAFMGAMDGSRRADGWYWLNLTEVTRLQDDDFNHWAPGHPHPGNRTSGSSAAFEESCMNLDGSQRMRWVSTHCATPKRFICHFTAVPRRVCERTGNCKKKKKKGTGGGRKGKRDKNSRGGAQCDRGSGGRRRKAEIENG